MSVSETAASAASPPLWMTRGLVGDAHLARLAMHGDPRAFEAIFERFHQELYRYCRAILGDSDEAQDALQSTMASALRSLPGDSRQIALRPWLYRVAHNEAISILRQRATNLNLDRLSEQVAPSADSEAELRERLRDLVADLDALPERQRSALVMRELSGLSYAEIGAALTASEGAARQAVYEARVALQELKAGRDMECEGIRRALSERDGRALRGRRLRAHLRACEACRDFEAGISQRRSDLQALCPPLPALAASGLLTALLGQGGTGGVGTATGAVAGAGTATGTVAGGGVATGTVAGGGAAGVAGAAGTAIAGSAAVKGASVVAAIVIGAGAVGVSGAVHLPLVGGPGSSAKSRTTPATPQRTAGNAGATPSRDANRRAEAARNASRRAGGASGRHGHSGARHTAGRRGGANATSASTPHGKPQASAGGGNPSATSNGSPPEHAAAGGGSGGGGHAAAGGGGHAPASPPGQANAAANAPTVPEKAHGKPGLPPGQDSAAGRGSGHGVSAAEN
jgi:RNA polymerase sigma factor (sigma-70 family)